MALTLDKNYAAKEDEWIQRYKARSCNNSKTDWERERDLLP